MTKPSLAKRVAATAADVCPRVEVTIRPSRSKYDRYWILEIPRCPFCKKVHNHGGGSIDHAPALGHRLSHCLNRARDYELVPVEEEATREH
jgi:hypothetical protein